MSIYEVKTVADLVESMARLNFYESGADLNIRLDTQTFRQLSIKERAALVGELNEVLIPVKEKWITSLVIRLQNGVNDIAEGRTPV